MWLDVFIQDENYGLARFNSLSLGCHFKIKQGDLQDVLRNKDYYLNLNTPPPPPPRTHILNFQLMLRVSRISPLIRQKLNQKATMEWEF